MNSLFCADVPVVLVGGVARWLGCQSLAGGLTLLYA